MLNYSAGGLSKVTRVRSAIVFNNSPLNNTAFDIVVPAAGKRFVVYGLMLSTNINSIYAIRIKTVGTVFVRGYTLANQPMVIVFPVNGLDILTADQVIELINITGAQVTFQGVIWGNEE